MSCTSPRSVARSCSSSGFRLNAVTSSTSSSTTALQASRVPHPTFPDRTQEAKPGIHRPASLVPLLHLVSFGCMASVHLQQAFFRRVNLSLILDSRWPKSHEPASPPRDQGQCCHHLHHEALCPLPKKDRCDFPANPAATTTPRAHTSTSPVPRAVLVLAPTPAPTRTLPATAGAATTGGCCCWFNHHHHYYSCCHYC